MNNSDSSISSDDVTMDELDAAIRRLGTGTGIDGINPDVVQFFPIEFKECIILLFNLVFGNGYPQSWEIQLLFPSTKKGHTLNGACI